MRTVGLIAMLALCDPVISEAQAADIRLADAATTGALQKSLQRAGVYYSADSPLKAAIRIEGRIVPGDAKKLDALIARSNLSGYIPLLLDSPGGSYDEAIKIADNIWLTPVVNKGAECNGACSIIFISGRSVEGDGESPPDRYAHREARISFFVPDFDFPDNGSSKALQAAFQNAVRFTGFLLRQRKKWNLPNRFFQALVDKSVTWQSVAKETKINVIE